MCGAMLEYSKALIDATYDIIPAVKLQSAYFEMYGIEGIKLYKEMIDYCKQKDMIVMADVKVITVFFYHIRTDFRNIRECLISGGGNHLTLAVLGALSMGFFCPQTS